MRIHFIFDKHYNEHLLYLIIYISHYFIYFFFSIKYIYSDCRMDFWKKLSK